MLFRSADGEVDEDSVWWYREKWKFAYDEVSYRVKQLSDLVEGKDNYISVLKALEVLGMYGVFIPHLSKHHRTNAEHHA